MHINFGKNWGQTENAQGAGRVIRWLQKGPKNCAKITALKG